MTGTASFTRDGPVRSGPRRWTAALPLLAWVVAIGAAGWLALQNLHGSGALTGYARSTPVVLAHEEPGTVRQVGVELYENVVAGQMLVALDDEPERLELAALELDLERLRAEVEAEEARLKQEDARTQQDALDLARQLAVDREDARLDLLAHRVELAQDEAELRGQRFEFELLQRLAETGDASGRELNEIRTAVERLDAAVRHRATLITEAEAVFASRDRLWQARLAERLGASDLRILLAPLRLEIEVTSREIAEVIRRLDRHVLRAPCDGRVASLNVSVGDSVVPNVALVTLAPHATDEVIAYLPETMTRDVHSGDEALLRCVAPATGAARDFIGHVTRVAPSVEEVPLRYRTFPAYPRWGRGVVVRLAPGQRLVPGEAVRIRFRPSPPPQPPAREGDADVGLDETRRSPWSPVAAAKDLHTRRPLA